jgi:hypothetical protein
MSFATFVVTRKRKAHWKVITHCPADCFNVWNSMVGRVQTCFFFQLPMSILIWNIEVWPLFMYQFWIIWFLKPVKKPENLAKSNVMHFQLLILSPHITFPFPQPQLPHQLINLSIHDSAESDSSLILLSPIRIRIALLSNLSGYLFLSSNFP